MNKLIGIRHPGYFDILHSRNLDPIVIEIDDMSKIENEIRHMLYDMTPSINHVVTSWRNKLYVCERVAGPRTEVRRDGSKIFESRPYDKSQVDYHPYQHLTS